MDVPYVITAHGMLDPWSLSQRSLKKRLYMLLRLRRNLNRAAAVHFTTDIERDLTGPLHIKAPAIVEPYCLDLSEFNQLPARGSFRKKFPQVGDRKIVLFLSRLHPKKGLDLLIPAFAHANAKDSVLVLAGPVDPDYEAELDRLIEQHGLRDRVVKTGMLYNGTRVAALTDAELFVLPSYQENFGIAVVEALAAGCPVVISDQVNIHRQVSSAGVGAVIPTNVEALAEQISHWMNDDAERHRVARRARDFAMRRYNLERSEKLWARHYAQVISPNWIEAQTPQEFDSAPQPVVARGGGGARHGLAALARHYSS
jgi:glycosyltransferase involved in cell wall biosynthesis